MRYLILTIMAVFAIAVSAPAPVASAATGYVPKAVNLCTNDFTVHTRTGINMNVITQMSGMCAFGPQWRTYNLCEEWPQVRSRTGIILNTFARAELCGQPTTGTNPGGVGE